MFDYMIIILRISGALSHAAAGDGASKCNVSEHARAVGVPYHSEKNMYLCRSCCCLSCTRPYYCSTTRLQIENACGAHQYPPYHPERESGLAPVFFMFLKLKISPVAPTSTEQQLGTPSCSSTATGNGF